MKYNVDNYIDKKFNKLTVIREAGRDKYNRTLVEVKCDCGNSENFIISLRDIVSNNTKSCGCYKLEKLTETHKKYNNYNLTGEYGIGYDYKGKEFYFDLDDYDKIKDVCWSVNSGSRVQGFFNNKIICIHKIILNFPSGVVDHINRKPYDNRKENLREVTTSQNSMNKKGHGKMSKFGLKGIHWSSNRNKWISYLYINRKRIYSKSHLHIEDAIKEHINIEKMYFGEYRYAWENNIKWDELLAYERELKKGEII